MNGNEEEYVQLCKIVLAGDSGVGKTHLLNRYVKGQITRTIVPTIGIEFAAKIVTLSNGEKIKAQIWDTAGQERYRSIANKRAKGALLVYDVTKKKTFDNVLRWMEDLKNQADPNLIIMLVGNKIDLCKGDDFPKVSTEDGKRLAQENNLLFEETSAITAVNVSSAFERLLEEISRRQSPESENIALRISQGGDGRRRGGLCKGC